MHAPREDVATRSGRCAQSQASSRRVDPTPRQLDQGGAHVEELPIGPEGPISDRASAKYFVLTTIQLHGQKWYSNMHVPRKEFLSAPTLPACTGNTVRGSSARVPPRACRRFRPPPPYGWRTWPDAQSTSLGRSKGGMDPFGAAGRVTLAAATIA